MKCSPSDYGLASDTAEKVGAEPTRATDAESDGKQFQYHD